MHDVFDATLESAAKALSLTRVPITWFDAPGRANGFLGARTTEPWVYKAGVAVLADLELDSRRDNLHHRSSGLDTTSAALCARHEVLVGINLANLRTLDPIILGRVQQNIALCRQHHATMCVFSSAKTADELPHEPDVRALLITLGMSPGEAKTATESLGRAYTRFLAKR